jgi:hypothetical protein
MKTSFFKQTSICLLLTMSCALTAKADQISDKFKACEMSGRVVREAAIARDKGISREYAFDYAISRSTFVRLSDKQTEEIRIKFGSVAKAIYEDLKSVSPFELESLITNYCLSN